MANPFGVPRPSAADPGLWAVAEQFANDNYQDVAGTWIEAWVTHRHSLFDFAAMFHEQWAAQTTDRDRWIYAVGWRLDTLVDKGVLDEIVKDIARFFLPDVVDDIIDTVAGSSDNADGIVGVLDAILGASDAAVSSVGNTANTIIGAIRDTNAYSASVLQQLTGTAVGVISESARRAGAINETLANSLLNSINRNNDSALNGMLGLIGRVTGAIGEQTIFAQKMTGYLLERVNGFIDDILRKVLGDHTDIIRKIGQVIDASIGTATDNNTRVSRAIEEALHSEVEQARRNSDAIERGLSDAIERITGNADSALSTVGSAIVGSSAAQTEATTQGAARIGEGVEKGFGQLGRFLSRLTGDGPAPDPKAAKDRINKSFDAMMSEGNCPREFGAFVHDFIDKITADWDPTTPLVHLLAEAQLLQSIFEPAVTVLGNCIAQMAARAMPTALPDPSEIREQMRRGIIDKTQAMRDLTSQGYNLERSDNMLAARTEIPDVGFVQTWFLRGFINSDQAIKLLSARGFAGTDIENLLKMAFFIPPPQDLITMAVREVFSPAVARRFGQFEDFPKPFADYARQQGISEDWAERYWAAHWSLPSPQQGFEMYQRDVISRDDLELLLKSLDIMPFWRERLTKIAFRPVSRVDIRRMHSLKLLTHDEMVTRYRHMGYSPTDAEFMAKFTERLNAPKGERDVEELEGATTATVVQLFARGAISEADARKILEEMGKGERAINVILTNEKMRRELQERDQETSLILEQAKAGILSFDEAEDRLAALGLTSLELATARTKLKRIQAQETRLPTRAEADQLYVADQLSDAEYLLLLNRLGYSLYWSEKFLRLAKAKEKKG